MQKKIFLDSEGDEWFLRNQAALNAIKPENDITISEIEDMKLHPSRVLEVGCSHGWRLNFIQRLFNSECYGIDPSQKAIDTGMRQYKDLRLEVGTADKLPFQRNYVNLVIMGFCLYVCDRESLFRIAAEIDRVLQDCAYVIITDFCPAFHYKNKYAYKQDLYSYKMDYSKMFIWNPDYTVIRKKVYDHSTLNIIRNIDDAVATTTIRKDILSGYPDNPF